MIISLTIGDLQIGPYASGFHIERLSGFAMPSTRVDMKDRGHYNGANLGYAYYGKRGMTVEGEIVGINAEDYETKRRLMTSSMDIMKGLQEVVVQTRGGLAVKVNAILANPIDLPYEKGRIIRGKFQFQLITESPFFRGFEDYLKTVNLTDGGGFAIPFAIPLSLAAGLGAVDYAVNAGNGASYPIITFYGVADHPTLTNNTTGDSISVGRALIITDTVTIDTYNHTAMLNGVTNITNEITTVGSWLYLAQGYNALTLTTLTTSATAKVTLAYNDVYIGI